MSYGLATPQRSTWHILGLIRNHCFLLPNSAVALLYTRSESAAPDMDRPPQPNRRTTVRGRRRHCSSVPYE